MTTTLLLISDIHGNYPALTAIDQKFSSTRFDYIINSGDSLVYAPLANETLAWLRTNKTISILGNTDKKVIKLLKGKDFKKPAKAEKRIMYTSTATVLTPENKSYLLSLKKFTSLLLGGKKKIGVFHGSPAAPHEFLFDTTPDCRFEELASQYPLDIIVTGHSHTPYDKQIAGTRFINPGSVGRMFDSNPQASCAVLTVGKNQIHVQHHRLSYNIKSLLVQLRKERLPEIYCKMYQLGQKLN